MVILKTKTKAFGHCAERFRFFAELNVFFDRFCDCFA